MNEYIAETAEVVTGMVRLAEGLGYALPWANLLDAMQGIATESETHAAVLDLIDRDVLETTTKGLRFALAAPSEISTSPGQAGRP